MTSSKVPPGKKQEYMLKLLPPNPHLEGLREGRGCLEHGVGGGTPGWDQETRLNLDSAV